MNSEIRPRLDIGFFGGFSVRYGSTPLRFQRGSNNSKVFAYLVLHPVEDIHRTVLARDLWPDASEDKGLSWIRDSLYNLRKLEFIENALYVTPDFVRWTPPVNYSLDVGAYNEALVQFQQAKIDGSIQELRHWVHKVIAFSTGELLPDLDGLWLDELRHKIQMQHIQTLEEAIAFLWQREDLSSAVQITTSLIMVDPLREASYRLRMELLAAAQDYSAVEDTYKLLDKRLRAELDAEPDETTKRIYTQNMAVQNLVVTPRIAPLAPKQPAHAPIGRQSEWYQLRDLWGSVEVGGSHCVLISGEAGIGKTFLAERFLQHLRDSSAFILHKRAYADDELNAFAPIYDWMQDERVQTAIDQLPLTMQKEIVRFHPQLMKRNAALSLPEPAIHPYQKRLLFDSVHAVLNNLDTTIVLYLDDIHWLDSETLSWLRHVLRHGQHSRPLFIIGTVRMQDARRATDFQDWMESLARNDLLTKLALRRLNQFETAELVEATSNIPFSTDAKLALYQLTEGNPLCIVEYLRTDLIRRENQSSIPDKISAFVQERVRFLSEHTLNLVWFASALGREFDYTLLAVGLEQVEFNILQALEEACQAEILQPASETTYRFTHGLVQEVIYNSLLPARRHFMHRRCAEALARQHQADPGQVAAHIAGHYERAHRWMDAQRYYVLAGDTEMRLGAFTAAESHYRQAQHLISNHINAGDKHSILAEVLLKLGAVNSAMEPFPQPTAAAFFTDARRLTIDHGDARLTAAALRGLWETSLNSNRLNEARDFAQELWLVANRTLEPELLCEAHWALGNTAFYMGNFEVADNQLTACISLYEQSDMRLSVSSTVFNTRLGALLYLAATARLCGKLTQSRDLLNRAEDLVRKENRLADVVYFQTHRLILAHVAYDITYGLKHSHEALRLARESGIPMAIAGCTSMQLWFDAIAGRNVGMPTDIRKQLVRDEGSTLGSTHFLTLFAQLHLARKDTPPAIELIDVAKRNLQRYGDAMMASILYLTEAQLSRRSGGTVDTIHESYSRALDMATAQQAHYLHLQISLDYAGLLQSVGQPTEARDLLHRSLAKVERVEDDHYVKNALRLLTML